MPDIDQTWPGEFEFCPYCGGPLGDQTVGGRIRKTCPVCRWVHFRNPAVGVAGVVIDDARLLLVKRGPTATRSGLWCIPCGFLDYGEEVRAGAAREVVEETGLEVEVGRVLWVASNFHDPAKLTVGIWFDATVVGGELRAGDDAVEAGFFPLDDLPDLAFETDAELIASLTR
ncbi:MAG: NUDIX hydrolase [Acidimicrobiia bacterium]|nr:NUDIX hydrolase [Acidimicrobiia bacterium]